MEEVINQTTGDSLETVSEGPQQQRPQSRKAAKALKKYIKNLQKQQEVYNKAVLDGNKKLKESLRRLELQLGKEDFNLLKQICTFTTPEEKSEAGEVIKPSETILNKAALIKEAHHLIVLKREQRILAGKRKRSSGRSSKRKSHAGLVRFLNNRNIEASKEFAVQGEQ